MLTIKRPLQNVLYISLYTSYVNYRDYLFVLRSTVPPSSPSSQHRTNSRTTDDLPSSSSFTSDGTLTPTQDIQDIPFFDDDTSSAYSCDTEGYYTSFHIDSGLRSVSYDDNKLATSASDSEVFGGGGASSAGTTGSISGSIGTVTSNSSVTSLGTVVMRNPEKKTPPKPPQRISSLDRKNSTSSNRESIITVIHVNGSAGSSREDVAGGVPAVVDGKDLVDSGRETSSSGPDPTSPRTLNTTTPEIDGKDADTNKKDSFLSKTAINASGIPSMCVITPPLSDDESVRSANTPRNNTTTAAVSVAGEDPSLGSVAAKAMLFQGGSSNVTHNAVRQVPRIETARTVPKSDSSNAINENDSTVTVSSRPNETKPQSKPSQAPSVEYSVNVRPSVIKQTDVTRRYSGDASQINAQPKIHKVPPPPPPREDSIDNSSARKVENTPVAAPANEVVPSSPAVLTAPQQPFSAVPPSVKQNIVITPTNSLERKKIKAGGAHVTLDSEGKVVYSSDSLPRRKPPYDVGVKIASSSEGGTVTGAGNYNTLPAGISSIQQMPLPPPPTEQPQDQSAAAAAALQQHQQHIQQQLLQQQQIQQQHQQLQQQQQLQLQQQALLQQRQEQEEKAQRQRQEELMLSRAVQQQIDQSKQEMLQQQNALKQQHQELQQQLHETRLELQRQKQEEQLKLQALRERQAYLQSKTPVKAGDKKAQKQQQKAQEQLAKDQSKQQQKLQEQQQKMQQEQQLRQQQLLEQQKQLQLLEQQKQMQLKQQQQQQLQQQQKLHQQQQQQILAQQQQYQQQLQHQALYGTRQDPYLYPTVPQAGGANLSQIPPIVPPPPPADTRQASGMGENGGGVIMASSAVTMSPRTQRAAAGAYVHVQGNQTTPGIPQQQQLGQTPQYPSRPHSAQGLYTSSVGHPLQQQQQAVTGTPGPTSRAPTPVQGAVTSSPRHTPVLAANTPLQLQQQQLALQQQQQNMAQLRNTSGTPYSSNNLDYKNSNSNLNCKTYNLKGVGNTCSTDAHCSPRLNTSMRSPHINSKLESERRAKNEINSYLEEALITSECIDGSKNDNQNFEPTLSSSKESRVGSRVNGESFLSTIIKSAKSPRLNKRLNKSKSMSTESSTVETTKDSDDSLNISLGSESYKAGTCVDDIPDSPLTSHEISSMSANLPLSNTNKVFAALAHARLGPQTSQSLTKTTSNLMPVKSPINSQLNCKVDLTQYITNHHVKHMGAQEAGIQDKNEQLLACDNDDMGNNSFQRNNSYRLANTPLMENATSTKFVSDNKSIGRNSSPLQSNNYTPSKLASFDRPMINDTVLYGPRVIVNNRNCNAAIPFNRHDGMYNSIPRKYVNRKRNSPPDRSACRSLSNQIEPQRQLRTSASGILEPKRPCNTQQVEYRATETQLAKDACNQNNGIKVNGSMLKENTEARPRIVAVVPKHNLGTEIW